MTAPQQAEAAPAAVGDDRPASLVVYNTLSRRKEPFRTIEPRRECTPCWEVSRTDTVGYSSCGSFSGSPSPRPRAR